MKKGFQPGEGRRGRYVPNTPSGNVAKTKVRFANEINSYRVGLTGVEGGVRYPPPFGVG